MISAIFLLILLFFKMEIITDSCPFMSKAPLPYKHPFDTAGSYVSFSTTSTCPQNIMSKLWSFVFEITRFL